MKDTPLWRPVSFMCGDDFTTSLPYKETGGSPDFINSNFKGIETQYLRNIQINPRLRCLLAVNIKYQQKKNKYNMLL